MKYIGNEELNKLAEKYADERAIENDTKNWMQIRGSYRAGFFAALKILRTVQPTEAEKSDEQPCFKHDVNRWDYLFDNWQPIMLGIAMALAFNVIVTMFENVIVKIALIIHGG